MVKLAYFSDTHFRGRKPVRRLDADFIGNQMKKLDDIVEFCIGTKIKALIHGGDLFDVPHPDFIILNSVAKRLKKLQRAKIPVYVTYGSHDLLGYRVDSVDKTGVGTLLHTGLIKSLIGPTDIGGIAFYGVPALIHHTVDVYKKVPPKHIIVTHNIVTSDRLNFEHLTFQDLAVEESTRIFLCAHYHKFFKIQVGNTYFFNTGPLVRTDKTEAEHVPNLLTFDIGPDRLTFNTHFVPYLQNALDLTDKSELGSICISGLKDTRIKFLDLFELTKQIAKENNIDQAITDAALQRLDVAQRSLAHG